ncbi:hypothetical protein BC828DRAFT_393273 [Blastocladiella britannica]|nr:hypothetical protein BC828DRAFT_393273 [Blastocladiella britannica]
MQHRSLITLALALLVVLAMISSTIATPEPAAIKREASILDMFTNSDASVSDSAAVDPALSVNDAGAISNDDDEEASIIEDASETSDEWDVAYNWAEDAIAESI